MATTTRREARREGEEGKDGAGRKMTSEAFEAQFLCNAFEMLLIRGSENAAIRERMAVSKDHVQSTFHVPHFLGGWNLHRCREEEFYSKVCSRVSWQLAHYLCDLVSPLTDSDAHPLVFRAECTFLCPDKLVTQAEQAQLRGGQMKTQSQCNCISTIEAFSMATNLMADSQHSALSRMSHDLALPDLGIITYTRHLHQDQSLP